MQLLDPSFGFPLSLPFSATATACFLQSDQSASQPASQPVYHLYRVRTMMVGDVFISSEKQSSSCRVGGAMIAHSKRPITNHATGTMLSALGLQQQQQQIKTSQENGSQIS